MDKQSERIVLEEELWQDADGKPVPYGDHRGVSVLFGKGSHISTEKAEQYGIDKTGKLKAVGAAPADKAVKGPERTK